MIRKLPLSRVSSRKAPIIRVVQGPLRSKSGINNRRFAVIVTLIKLEPMKQNIRSTAIMFKVLERLDYAEVTTG